MPLTRDYVLRLFAKKGLSPRVVARSESPETVRAYVGSGFGYALATARPRNRQALNGRPLPLDLIDRDRFIGLVGVADVAGAADHGRQAAPLVVCLC